jgi:hypothetical protein
MCNDEQRRKYLILVARSGAQASKKPERREESSTHCTLLDTGMCPPEEQGHATAVGSVVVDAASARCSRRHTDCEPLQRQPPPTHCSLPFPAPIPPLVTAASSIRQAQCIGHHQRNLVYHAWPSFKQVSDVKSIALYCCPQIHSRNRVPQSKCDMQFCKFTGLEPGLFKIQGVRRVSGSVLSCRMAPSASLQRTGCTILVLHPKPSRIVHKYFTRLIPSKACSCDQVKEKCACKHTNLPSEGYPLKLKVSRFLLAVKRVTSTLRPYRSLPLRSVHTSSMSKQPLLRSGA